MYHQRVIYAPGYQGVIANFKTHYRRLLLEYDIAKIDDATKATDVTSSINVLIEIWWVALAWNEVQGITIFKCFIRAGVLLKHLIIVVSFTSFHANATHRIAMRTSIEEVTSIALVAFSIFARTYCSSNY